MGALQVDGTTHFLEDQIIGSTKYTSSSFDVQQVEGMAIHILWDDIGSIAGTLTVETSNDNSNFTPIPESSQSISGSDGSHLYDIGDFHFRYLRFAISLSSGSSTFNVYINSRSRRI